MEALSPAGLAKAEKKLASYEKRVENRLYGLINRKHLMNVIIKLAKNSEDSEVIERVYNVAMDFFCKVKDAKKLRSCFDLIAANKSKFRIPEEFQDDIKRRSGIAFYYRVFERDIEMVGQLAQAFITFF